MSEDHYKKLERMYIQGAPINEFYKPEIKIGKGEVEIVMQIDKKFFHAANAVHGSVYFKMLDDAAFFASNSLEHDVLVLTANFNINFFRPIVYGKIRAIGNVVFKTSKSFVAEAVLYNEQDKEIARGSGTFVKSTIALNEDISYN